jgi:hypothetical protein
MKDIVLPCGQQLTESGASCCFCELSFRYSLPGINRLDRVLFQASFRLQCCNKACGVQHGRNSFLQSKGDRKQFKSHPTIQFCGACQNKYRSSVLKKWSPSLRCAFPEEAYTFTNKVLWYGIGRAPPPPGP